MCESVNLARFMPVYVVVSGTGIPAGTKSPPGIGDGEGRLPVVVHGDGAGENSPPPGGDGDGGLSSDGEFPVAIFSPAPAALHAVCPHAAVNK